MNKYYEYLNNIRDTNQKCNEIIEIIGKFKSLSNYLEKNNDYDEFCYNRLEELEKLLLNKEISEKKFTYQFCEVDFINSNKQYLLKNKELKIINFYDYEQTKNTWIEDYIKSEDYFGKYVKRFNEIIVNEGATNDVFIVNSFPEEHWLKDDFTKISNDNFFLMLPPPKTKKQILYSENIDSLSDIFNCKKYSFTNFDTVFNERKMIIEYLEIYNNHISMSFHIDEIRKKSISEFILKKLFTTDTNDELFAEIQQIMFFSLCNLMDNNFTQILGYGLKGALESIHSSYNFEYTYDKIKKLNLLDKGKYKKELALLIEEYKSSKNISPQSSNEILLNIEKIVKKAEDRIENPFHKKIINFFKD